MYGWLRAPHRSITKAFDPEMASLLHLPLSVVRENEHLNRGGGTVLVSQPSRAGPLLKVLVPPKDMRFDLISSGKDFNFWSKIHITPVVTCFK